MELETLKLFLAVADHGSFTRAAIQLGMTQPTISKRVQQLETQLRSRLLYRHGRGVRMTEAGVRLADVARSVLLQLDNLRRELEDDAHAQQGWVTIGLPPSLGASLSVPLAQRFKEKFPRARLRVIEAFSGSLLELLEAGKLDIGVLYDARLAPTMLVHPLFREKLYLIESCKTPGGATGPVEISELANGPFVSSHSSNGLRRVIEAAASVSNLTIDISVELDSLTAQKQLVEVGPERCILPYGAVGREVSEGKLRARPFVGQGLSALLVYATPLHQSVRRLTKELQLLLVEQVRISLADETLTGCLV